jgi:hypothetical protein
MIPLSLDTTKTEEAVFLEIKFNDLYDKKKDFEGRDIILKLLHTIDPL